MSQEPNNSGMEQVTVSKADWEAAQADAARIRALDEQAKEADKERIEELLGEYNEYLQDYNNMLREQEEKARAGQAGGQPPAAAKPAAQPAANGAISDDLQKQLAVIRQAQLDAVLRSHWVEYRTDQSEAPEEERVSFTKDELTKAINSDMQMLIVSKAQKGDGNLYKAAAEVLTITKGISKAKQEGAAAEAARQNAAAGSALNLGGRAKTPQAADPIQAVRDYQKKQADIIAPDDTKYVMGK